MGKRINVMLSDGAIRVLYRVAPRGTRSRLISQAILHYVQTQRAARLRERLKQGYLHNSRLNLEIAQEWFPLEEEAWQMASGGKRQEK